MVICKELNCELRAFYNFENDEWKCLYCKEHKKEGMVYLKKRRICIDESCKKNANFNFEDEKYPDYCNRPIVFIRFNPDTYINENGKKVLSSFKYHKTLDVPMIRNKEEWDNRLKFLKKTIVKWLKNIPKKEITIEKLFFDN
jgi:hypothetical protein